MKKKIRISVILFISVFLLIMSGGHIMYTDLASRLMLPFMKVTRVEINPVSEFAAEDAPLMAVVESIEDARETAGQYGIELISFEDGIALFQTKENPLVVISRGEQYNYPPLSVNYVRTVDEVTEQQLNE